MHQPIFLHIGLHKTGTSSVQHCLAKRRRELRQRGFVVPASLGLKNHHNMSLYALPDESKAALRLTHGLLSASAVGDFRNSLLAELKAEVATWAEHETLVVSSEHMITLHDQAEFDRLKELLALMGPRPIRIIIYLRRQDAYYVSAYAQGVKTGSTRAAWLSEASFEGLELDYEPLLDRWKNAFGKESLCVRVFEPSQLAGGDIVADFMATIGCHDLGNFEVAKNVSLGAKSTEFLRRITPWLPRFIEGRTNGQRRALVNALTLIPGDPRLSLDKASAMNILTRYQESNARIAREYLGRPDGRLFYEVPADEQGQPPTLSVDDAVELSAKLWAITHQTGTEDTKPSKQEKKAQRMANMTADQRRTVREERLARRANPKAHSSEPNAPDTGRSHPDTIS